MELLRSSILGKEFVNHRKSTHKDQRLQFSNRVRSEGIGNVPVVVDSVDQELANGLATVVSMRQRMFGQQLVLHVDSTVEDVLMEVKMLLIKNNAEHLLPKRFVLGLEDGTFPRLSKDLGSLYKTHKNKDDKILYFLLSQEQTMTGYIMSIIKYLSQTVLALFKNN